MEEKGKEATDEFQPETDTDRFEVSVIDGLACDKRGELAVLLPDSARTAARQRGCAAQPVSEEGKSHAVVEKGSEFSGTVRDGEGLRPAGEAEAGKAQEHGAFKPGQIPGRVLELQAEPEKPSMLDFDLDFGLPGKKEDAQKVEKAPEMPAERKDAQPDMATQEPAPPVEREPVAAPAAQPQAPGGAAFDEPELPDSAAPPLIIEGPKPASEPKPKAPPQPPPPRMKAGFYLEDASVVEKAKPVTTPRKVRKKKKMKLPRRVGTGKRAGPLLVALVVVLFLILVGAVFVQFVPAAREYYNQITAGIFGTQETPPAGTTPQVKEEDYITTTIGTDRIEVPKDTDQTAVETYTAGLRRVLSKGSTAAARRVSVDESE